MRGIEGLVLGYSASQSVVDEGGRRLMWLVVALLIGAVQHAGKARATKPSAAGLMKAGEKAALTPDTTVERCHVVADKSTERGNDCAKPLWCVLYHPCRRMHHDSYAHTDFLFFLAVSDSSPWALHS